MRPARPFAFAVAALPRHDPGRGRRPGRGLGRPAGGGRRARTSARQAALGGKTFPFELSKALARGPVVLYFFPAAFTAGCTKEAHDFAEASAALHQAAGATHGGRDRGQHRPGCRLLPKVECRDKFAVIADPGAKIAKEYKSTLALKPGWADRVSYVIGQDGKIKLVYANLNPDKHVDETLAEVKKLKPAG